jgi:FkbM family methyltransferase
LARTPYGYVLAPLEDSAFVVQLVEGGGEPGTNSVLTQRLRPGDVYVDVGAHVGTLLLNGARCIGPTGRAFAFEPTPRTVELLRRNVALNGLTSTCQISDVAVGRTNSVARLHLPAIYTHASLYELPDAAGTQDFEVQVRPLDDLIPADVHPTLVKIDVEGAELDVIAGMGRILGSRTPPALIVEYGREHLDRVGVTAREWFQTFADLGYRRSIIDEQDGSCRPADDWPIEKIPSCNILFEPGRSFHPSSQP